MHIITGGSDAEQRRDGDHLSKDERYDRTDEYLDILKQAWTSEQPFSYQGRHYQIEDFYSEVRSPQHPRIRLYFGGSSEAAYRVGGKHADTYALWGEPLAETKEQIDSVNAAAKAAGRTDTPGISVSFRPILGPTEDLAWERAHRILQTTKENVADFRARRRRETWGLGGNQPPNVGSQRLLAAAEKGELHDRALWTPLAAATGAAGNSTALVGTPETVAQAILDYIDIGVTTILIRGYDPYNDAIDYGRPPRRAPHPTRLIPPPPPPPRPRSWARTSAHDGFWAGTWPALRAMLPPPGAGPVIDVGCGEGRAARELVGRATCGRRRRAVADAGGRGGGRRPPIPVLIGDAAALPIADAERRPGRWPACRCSTWTTSTARSARSAGCCGRAGGCAWRWCTRSPPPRT